MDRAAPLTELLPYPVATDWPPRPVATSLDAAAADMRHRVAMKDRLNEDRSLNRASSRSLAALGCQSRKAARIDVIGQQGRQMRNDVLLVHHAPR